MTKVCTKCKKEKLLFEFNKCKRDGYKSQCKSCKKRSYKKWRENNKNYIRPCNKKDKNYYSNYYKENKDKILLKNKQYRETNKEKINKKSQEYEKKKIKSDYLYKLKYNIRRNIKSTINRAGYIKHEKTLNILGCNAELLLSWLNNEASNRLNYGMKNIHIDHVIPISWAETEEEVLALSHYSNLQLLTASDNLIKNNSEPKFSNLKRVFNNHPNKEVLEIIIMRN